MAFEILAVDSLVSRCVQNYGSQCSEFAPWLTAHVQQGKHRKHVPRVIFVDLDDLVVNELRNGADLLSLLYAFLF